MIRYAYGWYYTDAKYPPSQIWYHFAPNIAAVVGQLAIIVEPSKISGEAMVALIKSYGDRVNLDLRSADGRRTYWWREL